jgi:hypothetical protein
LLSNEQIKALLYIGSLADTYNSRGPFPSDRRAAEVLYEHSGENNVKT